MCAIFDVSNVSADEGNTLLYLDRTEHLLSTQVTFEHGEIQKGFIFYPTLLSWTI